MTHPLPRKVNKYYTETTHISNVCFQCPGWLHWKAKTHVFVMMRGEKSMMRKNVFEEKTKKNQVGKDTHQENTLGRGRKGSDEKYIAQ